MIRTNVKQRQEMYKRYKAGKAYREIAEFYGVSKEYVRYWCRRQRDGGNCETTYHTRVLLGSFDPMVRYCILRLRLEHPRWGPGSILAGLRRCPSLKGLKLPSGSQIGRYLHKWQRFRRQSKPERMLIETPKPVTEVHQRWQLDFKVQIELMDGELVNLHTLRDPVGEACMRAQVFPGNSSRVKLEEVRAFLRSAFAHWGTLPDEIQTDGEPVLAGRAGKQFFPSKFTLWLVGLGIKHRIIRPGKPTDNAAVERCHRTVNDYAIIGNEWAVCAQLNAILEQSVYELNYELPSRAKGCKGKPPVIAHPELLHPRRPFQSEHEYSIFDLNRIDTYLANLTWKRKVSKTGQVTIAGRQNRYTVGRQYASHEVQVRFDPADRNFVFSLSYDPEREISRQPAKGLEEADIIGAQMWPIGPGPQQLP